MRKGIIQSLLVFSLTAAALFSVPAFAEEGMRIAVASDLHLNPDDTKKGAEATAVQYNMELVDALLWDAKQQGAEMILLTGDLVNGGKHLRHSALAAKLKRAEESGLDVYVLPGNHDLGPVTQTEFALFYEEFGYGEAYSRDSASLSYCIIRDGLMILMMDTSGYPVSAIDLAEPPEREGAYLTDETLNWAEEMLKKGAEEHLRILCAGHYNLLPEMSRQEDGRYHIKGGERFLQLLHDYGVTLYLSGHMHVRAVYQEDGLTELLTEYLLGYPAGYSLLDLTREEICYSPRRIDVDGWAKETGEQDPVLLDYADWQQEGLRTYSVSNVEHMSSQKDLTRREKAAAADFFYAVMNAYWDGTLSEKRADLEAMPGYEEFFRCAEGYAYGPWLKELMRTAGPELAGFTVPWP